MWEATFLSLLVNQRNTSKDLGLDSSRGTQILSHSSLNLLTELVIKLLSFSFQNCYLIIRCFFRLAVVEQMVCQVN